MLPAQRNKIDIKKLSDQEQVLFAKYGKLPTHKNILMKMQKDRKYFDSGDYALSKAGVEPQNTVGTAIPNPEKCVVCANSIPFFLLNVSCIIRSSIPHASSPANGHAPLSISPTNPTSPMNKESGLGHDDETLNSLDDHPMSAES
ncbi:camp-regulated phosphoprotein/endosulfine conserved region-domain-containing protein [Mycena galopus ATCC 62051]|nr:camp-regulated phosphoprotein/endosulfine conserved region-domain-containing protein [Mycena galopus ATCC 62051]